MSQVTGKVAQIIGPVVDVAFASGAELPKIYDSLEVDNNGNLLILEVQSHIGENTVRTISMDSTDGLSRGVDAVATGAPIQMPIGDDVYGRLFNVIGDAIDGIGNFLKQETMDCQFTVMHQNLKIFQLLPKYYLQGLK